MALGSSTRNYAKLSQSPEGVTRWLKTLSVQCFRSEVAGGTVEFLLKFITAFQGKCKKSSQDLGYDTDHSGIIGKMTNFGTIVISNKNGTLFLLKLSYSNKYLSQPKL